MGTIEKSIKLLIKKNQTEYQETEVIASINPVGRDEFAAAGQLGYKATSQLEVWDFEYDGQTEVSIDGKALSPYEVARQTRIQTRAMVIAMQRG